MYQTHKQDNLIFNHLKTNKFKSIRIRVSFLTPITKENATLRAILPYMMRAGSKNFPQRKDVTIKLNDLYSAKFSAAVSKKGANHVVVFDLALINDDYTLFNENLFLEGLHFLEDIIYNPLLSKETYKEEYRLMEEYYYSLYSNKMRYTINNLVNTMFKDELYKINALGDIETLKTISYEDVLKAYSEMIHKDKVSVTVVGDIEYDYTLNLITKMFKTHPHIEDLVLIENKYTKSNIKTIEETQDVEQAKLVLGYRLDIFYKESAYYHALMFDMLFGGSSESLLFKTLREELGLVYSVQGSYNPFKGVYFIYIGINKEEKENTLKQINTLIQKVINQAIEEDYLEIAKKQYTNSLIQSYDSLSGLTYKLEHASLYETELNINKTLETINKVTLQDISHVAQKLKLDTISFLKGEDNE